MGNEAKKRGQTLQRNKPYEKGNWHSALAARRGLRLLVYYGLFALIYLFLGTALTVENEAVGWAACLLFTAAAASLMYVDGARLGETETARGEILYQRKQAGKPVDRADLDRSFHPLKGWFIAGITVTPLLLLCVPYALLAKKQTYVLQTLPDWVSAYAGHEEIAQALQFYQQGRAVTWLDGLRVAVRLLLFPFVGVAEKRGAEGLLWLDRMSPLLVCLPALGFPLGYRTGPRSRARVHSAIRANARRRQRREKKAPQARQSGRNGSE